MKELDKYDRAIQHLLSADDFGNAVDDAWRSPMTQMAGCLFEFAGDKAVDPYIGCLTMIRRTAGNPVKYTAFSPEITTRIQQDERIPHLPTAITPDSLYVFAEYQREIDSLFRNKPTPEEVPPTRLPRGGYF